MGSDQIGAFTRNLGHRHAAYEGSLVQRGAAVGKDLLVTGDRAQVIDHNGVDHCDALLPGQLLHSGHDEVVKPVGRDRMAEKGRRAQIQGGSIERGHDFDPREVAQAPALLLAKTRVGAVAVVAEHRGEAVQPFAPRDCQQSIEVGIGHPDIIVDHTNIFVVCKACAEVAMDFSHHLALSFALYRNEVAVTRAHSDPAVVKQA